MKNGVSQKKLVLPFAAKQSAPLEVKLAGAVVAGLLLFGVALGLEHGCGEKCPDGQIYSADAGRCITPE